MAATTATVASIARCLAVGSPKATAKPSIVRPTSLFSAQNLPKSSKSAQTPKLSTSLAGTAIAGAVFSALSSCDSALAVQQITQIAEGGDNRGIFLLLPIVPAIAWVLFNILQPALNQINRMRSTRGGVVVGLGLGGLAASGLAGTPHAEAIGELGNIAEAAAASTDNRGQLLLIVVAPAILWVLYNILQPALNQLNKMRNR